MYNDKRNNSRKYNYIENFDEMDSRAIARYQRRRRRRIKLIILKTILACATLTLIGIIAVMAIWFKNKTEEERLLADQSIEEIQEDVVEVTTSGDIEEPEEEEIPDEEPPKKIIDPEDLICFESDILSITSTPTSICIEWADAELGDYYVLYREVVENVEKHGKALREDGMSSMSSICTCIDEYSDSGEETEGNGWIKRLTGDNKFIIEGLEPNTQYHVHIVYADKSLGQYGEVFEVSTSSSGFCDPFKAVYSLMSVSERDEETGAVINRGAVSSVQMTSDNGCEGVVVKPMFETDLFNRAQRDSRNQIGSIPKGTKLVITPDEGGNYCYYDAKGYKICVRSEDGQYDGWIDAINVLIDMNKLFSVSSVWSMQFDRTNAYSSIFTAGGDAQKVETEPPEGQVVDETTGEVIIQPAAEPVIDPETGEVIQQEVEAVAVYYPDTRYNSLILGGETRDFLTTTGYNVIDGVTGLELKNYESKDYMPVIWDLAMELKQCQKNALENGYTIKMYEGYRPLSTSNLVYNMLNGSGSLANVVNNTNLAQGYITSREYNVGNYIGYRSRHNRGVATDLTIVRLTSPTEAGEEAHMQTKMHTLDFRCNMEYNTWEADLLTDIMIGHESHLEYLGLRQEWWHFQLRNNRKDLYPLVEAYGYEDFAF